MMKTLIIGLGNPILSDDGVGVRVAYALQEALGTGATHADYRRNECLSQEKSPDPNGRASHLTAQIDITEASVGGLRLMEMMVGYERVIIIDACTQGDDPPGSFRHLSLPDLEAISPTQHTASAHDTSLATALAMGRRMGLALPDEISIYAVRAANVIDFSDTPTPAVNAAIPRVTAAVLTALRRPISDVRSLTSDL